MSELFDDKINKIFQNAFEMLGYNTQYAKIVLSSRPELGQFQCNAAMSLAKEVGKNPLEIANHIVELIAKNEWFSNINIARPGFINFSISSDYLADWCNQLALDSRSGCPVVANQKKVVIDFGGPNIAKPMHVGHIRSTVIGDCLQRLYRFCGDEVISDIHLGDWGTQMGMLIEAIKKKMPEADYFDEHFEGSYPDSSPVTVDELAALYPQAAALCKADEAEMQKARTSTLELQKKKRGFVALWTHFFNISIESLKKDFNELGVRFNLWNGESSVHSLAESLIERLIKDNIAVESDGATIIELEEDIPPLILKKSDGAFMYGTTDLATIVERVNTINPDLILYVVDKRQALHFKQVFQAAKKCQLADSVILEHVGFGTVNGSDGKPFKTRGGGTMSLKDLIQEAKVNAGSRFNNDIDENLKNSIVNNIALSTLKIADLSNPRISDYIFDLNVASQFEGKTGPYLLYSAVRIKSMLQKAGNLDQNNLKILPAANLLEENLQLTFTRLPKAISTAYIKFEPHHLCDFAFELASAYNRFYAACNVLTEENVALRNSRIAMSALTLKQMLLTFDILGLEVPERM
jgi:arginyl-tRNA synthetase